MASIFLSLVEFLNLKSYKLIKIGFDFDAVKEEDSLYPKDCIFISNVDNPEMLTLIFRTWIIRLVLCMIRLSLNIFLNH